MFTVPRLRLLAPRLRSNGSPQARPIRFDSTTCRHRRCGHPQTAEGMRGGRASAGRSYALGKLGKLRKLCAAPAA
ncbi:MAG: hypothetical protein D6725_16455 [Planctomycetota bacterium]|nr:MAG: hypothetical protein D6725_16455 [Planctomycetota bacterium]